jgi:hypothetical protein
MCMCTADGSSARIENDGMRVTRGWRVWCGVWCGVWLWRMDGVLCAQVVAMEAWANEEAKQGIGTAHGPKIEVHGRELT